MRVGPSNLGDGTFESDQLVQVVLSGQRVVCKNWHYSEQEAHARNQNSPVLSHRLLPPRESITRHWHSNRSGSRCQGAVLIRRSDLVADPDGWFTTCTPQGRAVCHADPLPAFFIRRGGWSLDRFQRRDVEPRAIGTYFAGSCDHCISIQASSSPRVPHRSSMTLSC